MRKKLISKEMQKRKEKRNQYILVGVMVIILFGSVFGIIVGTNTGSSAKKLTYEGHTLNTNGYFYNMTVNNKVIYVSNNPNNLSINYTIEAMPTASSFAGLPLYIDAGASTPSQEIYENMYGYAQRIQSACLANSTCNDPTLPIKNCEENMIIIKESTQNKIYTQGKCTFIEGTTKDLNKLTDIFILKLFGLK